jgi:hypothetical protein
MSGSVYNLEQRLAAHRYVTQEVLWTMPASMRDERRLHAVMMDYRLPAAPGSIPPELFNVPPETLRRLRDYFESLRERRRASLNEAAAFACGHFRPSLDGRVLIGDIRTAYHQWCSSRDEEPRRDRDMASSLSELFAGVGLRREGSHIIGIEWARPSPGPTHNT